MLLKKWTEGDFLHLVLLLILTVEKTLSFPSGAPVEACDSLLPRHIRTSPKSPEESPFKFFASAKRYYPDSKRRKIKVQIKGSPFRGFFVVALDAENHQRVGSFVESNGMEPLPCSGITHTDRRKKIAATIIWEPPPERKSGEVLFLGTILESFSSYYSDLIASVPIKKKKKKKFPQLQNYFNETLLS